MCAMVISTTTAESYFSLKLSNHASNLKMCHSFDIFDSSQAFFKLTYYEIMNEGRAVK